MTETNIFSETSYFIFSSSKNLVDLYLTSKLKQLGSIADSQPLSSDEARMRGILFCLFLIGVFSDAGLVSTGLERMSKEAIVT
jgi:hypothetical protein